MCATPTCNALYKVYIWDLHLWVSLKGIETHIWSFGCDFSCAITTGCAEFKLPVAKIFVL